MKWLAASLLCMLFWTQAASSHSVLRVAAASDLRHVMPALINAFQRQHEHVQVQAVYGPSGRFYGQIQNGAPFHIFMSADLSYPRQLIAQDERHGEVYTYARGTLALWHRKASQPSKQDLYQARRIAIANPQHAPYGRMAHEWLKYLPDGEVLLERLVFAESAAQVAHMVRSGGADIGVSALSVFRSQQLETLGSYQAMPPSVGYVPISQGMLVTAHGRNNVNAQQFMRFMQGEGQQILQEHGFMAPPEPRAQR